MTFISDTCSPWKRLYAVLCGYSALDGYARHPRTHSSLFIERADFYTPDARAHLFNRNNAFLMENSVSKTRKTRELAGTCASALPGVSSIYSRAYRATYKHLNSLRFEIRQNDSSRQPLKAVNTLASTFAT